MDDSKIAFYSGVLQVIPVLLLAVFLGGRRLHPTIVTKQRFTGPGWARAIVGAAMVAMVAAAAALYADLDSLPIDVVIAVVVLVLFIGLLGTVYEVAKSADEERRALRDELSGDAEVDTGL